MPFPTQDEIAAGLEAYNRFIADVWASKQAELEARAVAGVRELAEREVLIEKLESVELHFEGPPAMRFEGATDGPGRLGVIISAPAQGRWRAELVAHVVVPFRRRPKRVLLGVRDLRLEIEIDVERTSPVDIRFIDSDVMVDFELKARGVGGPVRTLLEEVVGRVAESQLRRSLGEGIPDRQAIDRLAELGLAAQPVELPPEPPTPLDSLEEQAVAVSERIASPERHLRFGTVLNTLVARDDVDGPERGFRQFEDSAIWTGHFIAGEVYRHQVSRDDPDALTNIDKALDGLERLLRMTEVPGLLSRVAVPLDAPDVVKALENERIDAGHEDRLFTSVDGKFRSIGHITRDQYAGALLGTGLAALRVDDAAIAAKARSLAVEMLDYLVEQKFCPTEAVVDPSTGLRHTSVTYLLDPNQVLAILRLGVLLDAPRFQAAYDEFFPAWSVVWFFQWLRALDPHDSYFKFNLEHALGLVMLVPDGEDDGDGEAAAARRLERRRLALGFRAVRRRIRFHANAWFNLVELEALGDDEESLSRPRGEIEHETRHLITQAFERKPLILTVNLATDDPDAVVLYRGTTRSDQAGEPEPISGRVVDVVKRPGADFLWQRSPFNLKVVWKGLPEDPAMRSPNIDQTLPYWMARKLGL